MDRIDPNKIKEKEWMDMDNKFEQWKELDSYTVSKIKEWVGNKFKPWKELDPYTVSKIKEWMDNKFEQWKELDPDEPNVSDTPNVPNIPWEPEVSWFSAPGDGPWSNPESGH
jgi:hypothetical protein